MGVIKTDQVVFFPLRLDKHTEGLMVLAFDKFTAQMLSRDLEAARWKRQYRAIVDKPPCARRSTQQQQQQQWQPPPPQQSPSRSTSQRTSCCRAVSLVSGMLIDAGGNLVTTPVKISSFISRAAPLGKHAEQAAQWHREEAKRRQSCWPPCELISGSVGSGVNPVPASLRWQSSSEMHPDAKFCRTTAVLKRQNDQNALYEIDLLTSTNASSSLCFIFD
jgi:hypothetical protein